MGPVPVLSLGVPGLGVPVLGVPGLGVPVLGVSVLAGPDASLALSPSRLRSENVLALSPSLSAACDIRSEALSPSSCAFWRACSA